MQSLLLILLNQTGNTLIKVNKNVILIYVTLTLVFYTCATVPYIVELCLHQGGSGFFLSSVDSCTCFKIQTHTSIKEPP